MKARLKNGETIRIADHYPIVLDSYDSDGMLVRANWDDIAQIVDDDGLPLGFPKFPAQGVTMTSDIDWEQRRYEIAKAMLPSIDCNPSVAAETAVSFADALITRLKQR